MLEIVGFFSALTVPYLCLLKLNPPAVNNFQDQRSLVYSSVWYVVLRTLFKLTFLLSSFVSSSSSNFDVMNISLFYSNVIGCRAKLKIKDVNKINNAYKKHRCYLIITNFKSFIIHYKAFITLQHKRTSLNRYYPNSMLSFKRSTSLLTR